MSHQYARHWKPATLAMGLALVVHGVLLLTEILPNLLMAWDSLFPRPPVEDSVQLEMVSIPQATFEQNRMVLAEQPPMEPPPPEPPPEPKGQIVDIAPTEDQTPPAKARFLSEHNTKAKKEMVRAERKPDIQKPQPTVRKAKASSPPKDPPKAPHKKDRKRPKLAETMEVEPERAADEDEQAKLDEQPSPQPHDGQKVAMNEPGEKALADEKTGVPAPDFIRDLPTGPSTFLNSREYMYATFFNRVKRLVGQFWHPGVHETLERFRTIEARSALDELATVVEVSLKPSGDLMAVKLVSSCGVPIVDNLALQAFHKAAPFPNIPIGLIGPDGNINFRFGFNISLRDGRSAHTFRP